jgi:hypothetical protein
LTLAIQGLPMFKARKGGFGSGKKGMVFHTIYMMKKGAVGACCVVVGAGLPRLFSS